MTDWRPRAAMVLAAGFGKRMRPLTHETPKPLIPVMGQPMIDRILDRLTAAGIEKAVVNTHHLGDRLHQHLAGRGEPAVEISHEEDLLDTGGGVANALDSLGEEPFFVLNGDVFWLEGHQPALQRLAEAWDGDRMDALLLVAETVFARGYQGIGDFQMGPDGAMRRRGPTEVAPYAFTGVQILHPRLFQYAPEAPFSLNVLYDQAEASDRLYGLVHDGLWFHVGTPDDLEQAEQELYELGFRPDRTEELP